MFLLSMKDVLGMGLYSLVLSFFIICIIMDIAEIIYMWTGNKPDNYLGKVPYMFAAIVKTSIYLLKILIYTLILVLIIV